MPTTDCVVWSGYTGPDGYGRKNGKRSESPKLAHRYTWEKERGPIPEGMVIMHLCHNRSCVNIDHLRPGTQSENLKMSGPNLARDMRGERNNQSKLTEAQVREIRAAYASGAKQAVLAWTYGVTQTNISEIVNFKTWKETA